MRVKLENGIVTISSLEKTIVRFEVKTLIGYFLDYQECNMVGEPKYFFAIVTTGGIIKPRSFGTIGSLDCLYYTKFTKALDSLLELKGSEEPSKPYVIEWDV